MRLGVLETGEVHPDLRERHGDYPAMFRALLAPLGPELEFVTVPVVRGAPPPDPAAAEAWLVTGSRHGVYEGLPWIEPLKAVLRASVACGIPVIGVCFGHQILAEALGGRVELSVRGWGLGAQEYERVDGPSWMAELPRRFSVLAVHQDQVVAPPPGATVLARSAHCAYAALAYGDPERPTALSLQPHPEFTAAYVRELVDGGSGASYPPGLAAEAAASLARAVDAAVWGRVFVDFLRRSAASRAAA